MFSITDQESLRDWFLATKRSFPWREAITPYKVLIAEVMLQQTRADVVVPYFARWMQLFPSIECLASAPIEEVLKAWEGLGYYSRARNLHRAAEKLLDGFPKTYEELLQIPGVGPYTANAILSFAFHEPVIAIDANVERVFARFFATSRPKDLKISVQVSDPHEISEALIELGATVCGKKPACDECPLASSCVALREGTIAQFPVMKKRLASIAVHKKVLIHRFQNRFGVYRRPKGELFADLYMFAEESVDDAKKVATPFKVVHATATCYRFHLAPVLVEQSKPLPQLEYLTLEECLKVPFTAGHRKILLQIYSHEI